MCYNLIYGIKITLKGRDTVKVLIIGSYNFFSVGINLRLKREKHNTYIICGKQKNDRDRYKQSADVDYFFDPSDSSVSHIVDDIRPDVIIFTGAYDDGYNWDHEKTAAKQYILSLTNILGIAGDYKPKRFIYISNDTITDGSKKTTHTEKDATILSGEQLCLSHHMAGLVNVSIIKFSSLYGVPESANDRAGTLSELILVALCKGKRPNIQPKLTPIFVSDAVEVIFRVMGEGGDQCAIHNIHGVASVDTYKLFETLQGVDTKAFNRTVIHDNGLFEELKLEDNKVSGKAVRMHVHPENGIVNVISEIIKENYVKEIIKQRQAQDNPSLFARMIRRVKAVFRVVTPFVETVAMFALALTAIYFGYPEPVQLLILYIILVSAILSRFQMFVALVLSIGYYTFFHSADYSLFRIVSEFPYIFTVLIMIISGFTVSTLRDKLKTATDSRDFTIKTQAEEIAALDSMLSTSRDIKVELESRLLNNSDSLSKIYEIVSRLDALETRRVFTGALKVVSDVMRSNDISIYMSGNNSSYFRNVASSSVMAREQMGNSIKITDYQEMYEALATENVYVNRKLEKDLPIMALAISTGDTFNVVIMLWSIDFKDLGIYHINLFLILRMIITNSINRAYQYELVSHEQRYIEDTDVLKNEYFNEVLADQRLAKEETQAPFQLLNVKSDITHLAQVSTLISSSLRTTDYLGIGDDNSLYIILGGTSEADLPFVIKRLQAKGIETSQITT